MSALNHGAICSAPIIIIIIIFNLRPALDLLLQVCLLNECLAIFIFIYLK